MGKILVLLLCLGLVGCATTPKQNLTIATIENKINKGKTTKTDILKEFGEPNIITKNTQIPDVVEIWTYSKFSTEMGGSWASILLLGGFGAKTSMKGITLMIYFDKNEVVKDYSITKTQY